MPIFDVKIQFAEDGKDRVMNAVKTLSREVSRLEQRFTDVGWSASEAHHKQARAVSGLASQVRKLAAEVAGLYSAFKAFDAMKGFVQRGIEVNEQLESAHLSIASIISATNSISDSQGRALEGAEKFAAAEQLSAKMLKEMQVLALQTTASFADIADGVASIIAPATKAGIALEKLPKFAITAVQAMTTMGLQTNQMRTEIEAILSGNISKTQDVLATNLGITKEMVQEWQKAGTLMDNLMKRMESFSFAGVRAQQTWAGLKGNMGDALDYLSSFASKGLFDSLKTAWSDLIDFMINTDASKGEIGISKNLDGLMGLIKELEDEIGQYLVSSVHTLMDKIGDLNDPNNVQAIRDAFVNFKSECGNVIDTVVDLKNAVVDLASTAKAVFSWLPGVIADAKRMAEGGMALARGEITFGEFVNSREVTQAALDRARRRKTLPTTSASALAGAGMSAGRAGSHVFKPPKEGDKDFVGPVRPAGFRTRSTIGKYDGGGGKKSGGGGGKSSAERLAENSARYEANLSKLRNQVEALEKALQPGLTTYDRLVAKINAEADAAVKNAEVKKNETIRRKEATAAQAEEMASLEKRKAQLEAQQKLDELQLKTLRDRSEWYKEFAELTGDTSQSLEMQNQLLEKQALEWGALGIPMNMVNERLRIMRQELATDPLSGLQRGFRKLTSEGMNWAQTTEAMFTNTCSMMTEGFANFVTSGKLGMDDLLRSWIAMINQMVAKAVMSQIFSMIGQAFSFVGGGLAGAAGSSMAASKGASWVSAGNLTSNAGSTVSGVAGRIGGAFALGGVLSGVDGYRNQVVTHATPFFYGHQLTRFARGGVMGEAGPEAVMPLTRMGNGNLGVAAAGAPSSMEVTLVINDQTSGGVTADAQNGELDGRQIAVIVRQVEQNMVSRAMNGKSPYTRYLDKTRGLSNAKQLY